MRTWVRSSERPSAVSYPLRSSLISRSSVRCLCLASVTVLASSAAREPMTPNRAFQSSCGPEAAPGAPDVCGSLERFCR